MRVKKGFTLSEVMVTLGVLGVLAAILIPAITKVTPSTERVMFKKAHATLEKAVSEMIEDETNYPSDEVDLFDPLVPVPRGFNYTTATTNGTTNKFCYFLSERLNTVGVVTCPATIANGTGTFTTTDGISWTVYIPVSDTITDGNVGLPANQTTASQFPLSSTLFTTLVTVDVNGTTRGPNCSEIAFSTPTTTECAGGNIGNPDIFRIAIRYDGKLSLSAGQTVAIEILSDPTSNIK